MFIITRLQILNCTFLAFLLSLLLVFSTSLYSQDKVDEKKVPDEVYLLLNEKSAIKNITRKNNNYTRTSLLRLLEINSELATYYIKQSDKEEINLIYNESYEIIEYLRNFNSQSEFYPAGIVRFSYILYKLEEYKEALKYLQTAKSSKYLREADYIFAVKINAQLHYELRNYQNVVDQFNLIQDRYFDKIDDELLLVYSKALFNLGNFNKAYQTLVSFIKSFEKKNKSFSGKLLNNIHVFFVDANQIIEGLNFLKKHAPENLPSLIFYALKRNKKIDETNKVMRFYEKWEKDISKYYEVLKKYLIILREKGAYRYMAYFQKSASNLIKRRKISKDDREYMMNFFLQILGDYNKYNLATIYSKRLLNTIINTANGFDGYATFLLAKHYLKNNEIQKAFTNFDQAYRLSASQYKFTKQKIVDVYGLEINRKKIITKSLDFLYYIFLNNGHKFIADDDQKDLLENYNTDNPKGKSTDEVFLSLLNIYLVQLKFDSAVATILNFLDNHPTRINVYREPIKRTIQLYRQTRDPKAIARFDEYIISEIFSQKIFNSKSKLSTLAKTEFLFNIGLVEKALELVVTIKERDFKERIEKNRFLLFAARIHLKNILFKESSLLLSKFIKYASLQELEDYSDIIIEAINEFYNIQDISTPLELSKLAVEKVHPKLESFEKYIATYFYSLLINQKEKELLVLMEEKEELFNEKLVALIINKSLDFILLDENFNIYQTFLRKYSHLLNIKFETLEKLNLKFHEYVINNDIEKSKDYQKLMLDILDKLNMEQNYKDRIIKYYQVRDLLMSTFNTPIIEWKFQIENPNKFIDENVRAMSLFESQINEFKGDYAFTDLLISAYFFNQIQLIKRQYKKQFNQTLKPVEVTQIVDLDNLDGFDPIQILSIKEKQHKGLVNGMTNRVKLFSSDVQLSLDPFLTNKFEQFFDYPPVPFLNRLQL